MINKSLYDIHFRTSLGWEGFPVIDVHHYFTTESSGKNIKGDKLGNI